ncbi:LGFP repeat-containing protein, partial [Arthrobacter sp. HMWF013]|uniref:LGFP repeat-containing protein n=1 Tax=Arthrobacter sp. HMWF013 TaxID=2056849 RepID=UPI000D34CA73
HSGSTESITVAKDSVGKLWVTYTVVSADNSNRVYINHSTTSDTAWGTPFVLPTTNAQVHHDDISAVTSFQGDKIAIMWSNQRPEHKRFYLAIHQDGQPENSWQTETAYGGGNNCTGGCANDHLNLRQLTSDGSGRLYAAIKTAAQQAGQTFAALLVRDGKGQWTSAPFGAVEDAHTRPMVMIDEEHRQVWMFAVAPEEGGTVYYKKSPIDNVSFPPGAGTPIIRSSTDKDTNDPTSTKQNVTGQTGLVVLAAARTNARYWHAYIDLRTGQSPIAAKAASLNGALGAATTAEVYGLKDNGGFQCFQRGCILYSPATGAHVSLGAIRGKWAQTGYENGRLGYPVTDEVGGLRDGGVFQNYQGGAIIYSPATGARISVGAIRGKWAESGYENGRLGYPVSDEVGGLRNGGVFQNYQGGAIIHSPATGPHLSVGGIRTIWASTGYESGRLGYPTSEEYATPNGGVAQNYQGGIINLSPRGHTITLF